MQTIAEYISVNSASLMHRSIKPTLLEEASMSTDNPISQELQAKIDALPDENLRANISRRLNRPWKRTKSNEQIFEEMLANYKEVMSERAKWRQWRDDEVQDFVEYFKQELPEDYVEYLRQERENNAIDSELSWRVRRLVDKWTPDLTYADNGNLVSKVRDHLQAQLRAQQEQP
jgi:hypothetical protein